MITQTFGEILFTPGSEPWREFPSPESLKRRILISTKPPKEYNEAMKDTVKKSNLQKSPAEVEAQRRDFIPKTDYNKVL